MTAQTVLPAFRSTRARTAGIAGLLTAVAVAGAVASVGSAAEAGTAGTAKPVSITLNGDPALGSWVTFDVNMNGNRAKNPRVVVDCYQNGETVFSANRGLKESVKLGGDSSQWVRQGGGASCTAVVSDYVYAKGQWTVTTFPGQLAFDARG